MKPNAASIPQLYHLFVEYPWVIYLTSLCFSFLMCKVSNSRTNIIDLLLRIKLGNIYPLNSIYYCYCCYHYNCYHYHCFSVAMSCLCNPVDCSMPGFPVLHYPLKFAQTHVHWLHDAIQPFHPLASPSPLAPRPSQHEAFLNELALYIRWAKYWGFSFSIFYY